MIRAVLFLFASLVAFAGSYAVQVIPPPSGFTIIAVTGINSSGQVGAYGFNGVANQAFIGSLAGSSAIPAPSGWTNVNSRAINEPGQVVGTGTPPGTTLPQTFIGAPTGSVPIPLAPGLMSENGSAINNSGQVVGGALPTNSFIGTTSSSSAFTVGPNIATIASAINSSGQVAGFVFYYPGGIFAQQAFIGGTVIPLPPGWGSAAGYAINDSGQVVGYGSPNGSTVYRVFIGTTSASSAIPPPPGATTATVTFQSINNSGAVVGLSDAGGWIWDAVNGTRLVNGLVPAGWNVTNALSISNSGLILAQGALNGGASQYVELVPVVPPATPAPSTWLLVVAGLGLLGLSRWAASRA
jgi:hypothetical protein